MGDEFVDGLMYLQETLSVKHFMDVELSVKRVWQTIDNDLYALTNEMGVVREQHQSILEYITLQDKFYDQMSLGLDIWKDWVAAKELSALPSTENETDSHRLSNRLSNRSEPGPEPESSLMHGHTDFFFDQ